MKFYLSLISLSVIAMTRYGHCGQSFVDIDPDIHRMQRNLLQDVSDDLETGEPLEEEEEKKEEPPKIVYQGLAKYGEYKLGPRLFFDSEQFLMKLGSPIKVTIFPGSKSGENPDHKLSVVDLDGEAVSIKGSMIGDKNFKVNLDWKSKSFGNDFKITSIQIHMEFGRTKDEYMMTKLEVVSLTINGKQMHTNELEVKSKYGYKVIAPLGSSFCCYDPGMFGPKEGSDENTINAFRVGVTFPKMQLQVFNLPQSRVKFGPEWACDSFMGIGLWVGLLLTLLFASVCVYGFTMLANIQTMDRFDDPRGKTIHVPQTD